MGHNVGGNHRIFTHRGAEDAERRIATIGFSLLLIAEARIEFVIFTFAHFHLHCLPFYVSSATPAPLRETHILNSHAE
jgi:hypothetical protein